MGGSTTIKSNWSQIELVLFYEKLINRNCENILEVGPGTGNLTREIIKKNPKKIFLIEKDELFCKNLKKEFKDKINIFNEDILKSNEKIFSKKKLIVFGNLHYNKLCI